MLQFSCAATHCGDGACACEPNGAVRNRLPVLKWGNSRSGPPAAPNTHLVILNLVYSAVILPFKGHKNCSH
jgi:hypothetical protein